MNWRDYIEADLRSGIYAGGPLPVELTLSALASHYDVSWTPVRQALDRLIEQKLIAKKPNGRLEVRYPKRRPVTPLKRPTKPIDYFDVITIELVRQSLLGISANLKEEAIARQFGISTTVVRQVFHRLAGMGVLEHQRRIGWTSRAIEQCDFDAFLEARRVVELRALRSAFHNLDPARIRVLLKANTSAPGRTTAVINNDLHSYFAQASNNRFISDFFQRNVCYFQITFRWEEQIERNEEVRRSAAAQHCGILQAILEGDIDRACKRLEHHLSDHPPDLEKFREEQARAKSVRDKRVV